ncbi:MAG TPA: TetR family transcriptional regulator [Actinoallomurus sp.]|nr:TetR family transcriptional regulator [Actinoallomurus sp.]
MSTPPLERPIEGKLSLRERKKLKTRRAIQEHALRLFREQGYDATTVEQIAEAAEVSPSTFFRYYPTKEDTVLTDEYDPMIVDTLRAQPPELPPVAAARATLRAIVGEMLADDRERLIERSRLLLSVSALRARQWDQMRESQNLMLDVLAERLGRSTADLELRLFVAAILAVWETAVMAWVEDDGRGDLLELLDRGMAFLTAGVPLSDAP